MSINLEPSEFPFDFCHQKAVSEIWMKNSEGKTIKIPSSIFKRLEEFFIGRNPRILITPEQINYLMIALKIPCKIIGEDLHLRCLGGLFVSYSPISLKIFMRSKENIKKEKSFNQKKFLSLQTRDQTALPIAWASISILFGTNNCRPTLLEDPLK